MEGPAALPFPSSPWVRRALRAAAQSLVTSHPDGAGFGKEMPQVETMLSFLMTEPVSPGWFLAQRTGSPTPGGRIFQENLTAKF